MRVADAERVGLVDAGLARVAGPSRLGLIVLDVVELLVGRLDLVGHHGKRDDGDRLFDRLDDLLLDHGLGRDQLEVCTLGQDRVGHEDVGRHAVAAVGLEHDVDAVALGQPAHHEQSHASGGVRGDRDTEAQVLVDDLQLVERDAKSGVAHCDRHAVVAGGRRQGHVGVGRGVRQRVVDELGEQVDQVTGGRLVDLRGE